MRLLSLLAARLKPVAHRPCEGRIVGARVDLDRLDAELARFFETPAAPAPAPALRLVPGGPAA